MTPRGAGDAIELGTTSPGASVQQAEVDQPNPRTQQGQEGPRENIQATDAKDSDPGPQVVTEAPTLGPVSVTAIANRRLTVA